MCCEKYAENTVHYLIIAQAKGTTCYAPIHVSAIWQIWLNDQCS